MGIKSVEQLEVFIEVIYSLDGNKVVETQLTQVENSDGVRFTIFSKDKVLGSKVEQVISQLEREREILEKRISSKVNKLQEELAFVNEKITSISAL